MRFIFLFCLLPFVLSGQVVSTDTLYARDANKNYKPVSVAELWAGVARPTGEIFVGTTTSFTSEAAFAYILASNRLDMTDGTLHLTETSSGTTSTDGTNLLQSGTTFVINNQEGATEFRASGASRIQAESDGDFVPVNIITTQDLGSAGSRWDAFLDAVSTGNVTPKADNTHPLGSTSARFSEGYFANLVSGLGTLETPTMPLIGQINVVKTTASANNVFRLKSNEADASSPLQFTALLRGHSTATSRGVVLKSGTGGTNNGNFWLLGNNVGIGVDDNSAVPVAKLEVLSAVAVTSAPTLRLGNSAGNFDFSPVAGSPEGSVLGAQGDFASDITNSGFYAFHGADGSNTGWVGLVHGKLATVTGINSKTTGTTNLFTVPTGKTAVITSVVIRVTASSSITVPCTAGVGIASGEDDVFDSEELTGMTQTGKSWVFNALGAIATGAATNIVKLGIDTAATGTSQTIAVDVFGYIF